MPLPVTLHSPSEFCFDPSRAIEKMNRFPASTNRILFVDDSHEFLQIIGPLMKEVSGGQWDLVLAHDTQEAIKNLEAQRIDLVVSDLRMAPMDGVEFLR